MNILSPELQKIERHLSDLTFVLYEADINENLKEELLDAVSSMSLQLIFQDDVKL